MRNMQEMKRELVCAIVSILLIITAMTGGTVAQYRAYNQNYNQKLGYLCEQIRQEDPQINEGMLMKWINEKETGTEDFFEAYGIDVTKDAVLQKNDHTFWKYLYIELGISVFASGLLGMSCFFRKKKEREKLQELTDLLSKIQQGRYQFDMQNNLEGPLSILEGEIYKITIMLKEAAENSRKDKEMLKDFLSDISHQIKTPLTALLINLENLEDHPGLEADRQKRLIRQAKREGKRIRQMIQMLLQLSRFDAKVISFQREKVQFRELITDAIENVDALCDLKGIAVRIDPDAALDDWIECDPYWEKEALTNILKNGVEHAKSELVIGCRSNAMYQEIWAENDGRAITKAEAKHVFERFYRNKESTADSVGIGLSLADAIVKKDGGYIIAEPIEEGAEYGTRFVIRFV